MRAPQLLHPAAVGGLLGCVRALAAVSSAAVDSGMRVFLAMLVSSGYMPRSGIAGSYHRMT